MLAIVVGRKESSSMFITIIVVIIGVMVWFLLLDFDFVRMYSVISMQTFDSIFALSIFLSISFRSASFHTQVGISQSCMRHWASPKKFHLLDSIRLCMQYVRYKQ